jgi:hypothetical protein
VVGPARPCARRVRAARASHPVAAPHASRNARRRAV